jgi:hypothetical protein
VDDHSNGTKIYAQDIENPLDNSVSSLEWWQIPDRFKRSTLQDSEISQINSGGADIMFK